MPAVRLGFGGSIVGCAAHYWCAIFAGESMKPTPQDVRAALENQAAMAAAAEAGDRSAIRAAVKMLAGVVIRTDQSVRKGPIAKPGEIESASRLLAGLLRALNRWQARQLPGSGYQPAYEMPFSPDEIAAMLCPMCHGNMDRLAVMGPHGLQYVHHGVFPRPCGANAFLRELERRMTN